MKKTLITIALTLTAVLTASAQAIGTWRAYPAYSSVENIHQAGTTIFVQASGGLYSYSTTDHSITTYDKATQLNDCGISLTAWCQAAHRLVIVYENGNIDLLDTSGNVINMSEYMDKSMTEDKTIFGLDISGAHAYLSTGFGIVNINVSDANVSDTYNLGFRVDWCSFSADGGTIYAHSSTKGTYSAPTTSNLLDPASWSWSAAYTAKTVTTDTELQALVATLSPGGPAYNYFGYMNFKNNRLYTSGGGWKTGGEYFRPGCVQLLKDNEWQIFQDDMQLPNNIVYRDVTSIAIDPSNPEHIFTGNAHCGILEFLNGKYVTNYNADNSPVHAALTDGQGNDNPNYIRVDGLVFSEDGNLYVLNSSSINPLIEFTSNKEWKTFNNTELLRNDGSVYGLDGLRGSFIDSRGLLWFVNDNYLLPSVICFNRKESQAIRFSVKRNQDGNTLNLNYVTCITEDAEQNLWIGTDVGVLLLTTSNITDNEAGFTQIKIPRNDGTNYADYLLDGTNITAIKIDEANRKWIGTYNNGVYLISEDNMTQLQHFTSSNSKLLSDKIESIAIDNERGEVFFGTDKGLCSYISDATSPSDKMTKDNVYAYPNPVRPDYTGMITVTGLTYNAEVKITTSNGVLVAEGRSTGGTFQWDGLDLNGKRVASGIYMVNTSTESGDSGTVCKIAVVN